MFYAESMVYRKTKNRKEGREGGKSGRERGERIKERRERGRKERRERSKFDKILTTDDQEKEYRSLVILATFP